jgi:Asp-tRNA(Asn)/Glu-tRNA(Gln) amidotransferase A subunit family amidase
MGNDGLTGPGAAELARRIGRGELRAAELARACLDRVRAREPEVEAWVFLDEDAVLREAEARDRARQEGRPCGPLHGLPVAVKDVIDTARIPTENGAVPDRGRVPAEDAWVVRRLRAAGAVIMGKTVTAELAFMAPGKTRNPRNPEHTPGGSSSGSAAAVADGMVPLALGTQTTGSVIRPASYCGITGFKPTFGAIPRTGVLSQSPSLDTLGVFARGPEDAALLAEVLFGDDPRDPATAPAPAPRLFATACAEPPLAPVLAFVKPPFWAEAEPDLHAAMAELAAALGAQCHAAELPADFAAARAIHRTINMAEMAHCYRRYRRDESILSPQMQAALAEGDAVGARDYLAAKEAARSLALALEEIFARCDAILAPAATGPAPAGLGSTGNSVMNGLWTLTGNPAVTIPVLEAANGMPMGAQLVGRHWEDGRLLRTARWLARRVETIGRT